MWSRKLRKRKKINQEDANDNHHSSGNCNAHHRIHPDSAGRLNYGKIRIQQRKPVIIPDIDLKTDSGETTRNNRKNCSSGTAAVPGTPAAVPLDSAVFL